MGRMGGRNIYIVNLAKVLGTAGPQAFAARCNDSKFSAVWVRVGRGPKLDKNFTLDDLPAVRNALDDAGIELWGWHVPFCANNDAAHDEAKKVVEWANKYALAGMLLDAEKTPEFPRFRGKRLQAKIYAEEVEAGLSAKNRGMALSSHDQPSLHQGLPFDIFLEHVEDNCPQVYYNSENVASRLNKSIHDYQLLEAGRDFKDRYKPTGNVTTRGDVALPSAAACLAATKKFIDLVKTNGYRGYSFWCWDDAPNEIWAFFQDTPV